MVTSPDSAKRNVLITGASTGIGAGCAAYLHKRGFRVFAGIRKPEDGERLQNEISKEVIPVRIDVQDAGSIREAAARFDEAVGGAGLHGLVNNAGIGVPGPMEFIPLDELRRQFEVNLFGQVAVTQAFLRYIRPVRGRIVNISSMGGRVTTPYVGPYHASKYALEAVNDALRMELRPWGISVSCVEPGSIATPIWTKSKSEAEKSIDGFSDEAKELYGRRYIRFGDAAMRVGQWGIPPERVAKKVAHALESSFPRTRYLVGPDAHLMVNLSRILPAKWMDWVILKVMGS
ncbi:MAG: short-chain dehydrogenase [Candidatus Hydrogenedentota bacterium]